MRPTGEAADSPAAEIVRACGSSSGVQILDGRYVVPQSICGSASPVRNQALPIQRTVHDFFHSLILGLATAVTILGLKIRF
jgi:hypothetical protein